MAKLIWTEPALADLDAIADYIALDKPDAARQLVQRVFQHVEQLIAQPESGPRPPELRRSRYRQIIEAPSRIFYRYDGERVFIL
jgi:toxin ParE1/3/4